jgi:ABC-2 type transport system permease protein
MFALYKKELATYFHSLIAYLVIVVFLIIISLFLWVFPTEYNVLNFGYANLDSFFLITPIVFLFLIPAISMRLFAEEKKSGTIELLFTRPLSEIEIIAAKYLAGFSLILIALLPTIIYVFTVYRYSFPISNIDLGVIWGSYLGLLLLAAAFLAVGIFASSLTDNQIVAFLISVSISAFAYLGFEIIYSLDLFGQFDLFVKTLGIQAHYSSMRRGVIDLRDLIYFLSISAMFLLFTHTILTKRKW